MKSTLENQIKLNVQSCNLNKIYKNIYPSIRNNPKNCYNSAIDRELICPYILPNENVN